MINDKKSVRVRDLGVVVNQVKELLKITRNSDVTKRGELWMGRKEMIHGEN